MMQLLGISLFCTFVLYALHLYKKEMAKVAVRVRPRQTRQYRNTHETLVQDPVTGIYTVKR